MMRLAISFQRVDPTRGGAETYVADLCRRLVALGHDVTLYADRWNAEALPADLACERVKAQGWTRWSRIRNFAEASERALKAADHDCVIGLINTWHQDVLIPQGGVHAASLEANSRRFPPGWRRWLYLLSKRVQPKSWGLYRTIERRQYDPARPTRYVAVSHMVQEHLERFHHVAPEKIRVIPNAIDSERIQDANGTAARAAVRERHGLLDSDVVALFVGHNFRLKGLPALLQALALRSRQDSDGRPIHLLACGGGRVAPMRKLAERLGLAERVRIVGFAPEIRDYYHAADCFILPSYYDPCSLVVFEALACGLPVITTACNGAGEVITEGQEGFVIPRPDDLPAMVAALDRMTDDAARSAMARRAIELGRAQSLENHVQRLLDLCDEVARSKAATRKSPHGMARAPLSGPNFATSKEAL